MTPLIETLVITTAEYFINNRAGSVVHGTDIVQQAVEQKDQDASLTEEGSQTGWQTQQWVIKNPKPYIDSSDRSTLHGRVEECLELERVRHVSLVEFTWSEPGCSLVLTRRSAAGRPR